MLPLCYDVTPNDNISCQQVVASDSAPAGSKRSSTVSVKIDILDENDNPPLFSQFEYSAIIVDNIPFYPDPSPIVQVSAIDPDQGINAELFYDIVFGNEDTQFQIDHKSGIIYPNASFVGKKGQQYELTVEVLDEAGQVRNDL